MSSDFCTRLTQARRRLFYRYAALFGNRPDIHQQVVNRMNGAAARPTARIADYLIRFLFMVSYKRRMPNTTFLGRTYLEDAIALHFP